MVCNQRKTTVYLYCCKLATILQRVVFKSWVWIGWIVHWTLGLDCGHCLKSDWMVASQPCSCGRMSSLAWALKRRDGLSPQRDSWRKPCRSTGSLTGSIPTFEGRGKSAELLPDHQKSVLRCLMVTVWKERIYHDEGTHLQMCPWDGEMACPPFFRPVSWGMSYSSVTVKYTFSHVKTREDSLCFAAIVQYRDWYKNRFKVKLIAMPQISRYFLIHSEWGMCIRSFLYHPSPFIHGSFLRMVGGRNKIPRVLGKWLVLLVYN